MPICGREVCRRERIIENLSDKMTKLMLIQILLITVQAGRPMAEPPTTMIQDTRTEISVEEVNREDSNYYGTINEADSDLDFDYEDEDVQVQQENYPPFSKEHLMKEAMLKAMKKPAIREQIGEVIPILRVMSPVQRLTLAALVSSQIMSQGRLNGANLTEMAAMFAGSNVKNMNDRQNITEHLLLPISVDVAKIFRGLGKDVGRSLRPDAFDRGKMRGPFETQFRRRNHLRRPNQNRRMDVFLEEEDNERKMNTTRELQKLINEGILQPSVNDCEYFSSSFCLEVSDYPLDAIIKSVERHQGLKETLLEDFRIQSPEANGEGYVPESQRIRRRQDTGPNEITQDKEYMCPSSVKYARPKRARTTTGQWKYIVNAGDYTQTLRLEMCLKPMAPCSYVTNNFHSQCTQVYNYHRLLTWEENKGLHMDIFKVPSCCSCHIQGYNSYYPPVKDYSHFDRNREPISLRPSYKPESAEIGLIANPSGKREIVRPPPAPVLATATPQTFAPNVIDHLKPLHHLLPRGPPLPLEGERINFRSESTYHTKRGSGEHRRIAEIAPHKLEIGEPSEKQATRIKYSNVILGGRTQERSPIFSPTPAKFQEESVTGKTVGNAVGNTEKTFRKSFQPSREITTTTVQPTFQQEKTSTATARKKINYNYHPIIEFFKSELVNNTSEKYSKPFSSALTSQEWTPLVARSRI